METTITAKRASEAPEWITYREAEKLVGLSTSSLYRLGKSGAVRVARVGPRRGGVRLHRGDLLAYMDEQTERRGERDG